MKRTSASEKTITLSNTEMLTLGKELSETGADISICNPCSDHVPGGGAYNDRGDRRLNGSNGYKENEGATPEHPGSFNLKNAVAPIHHRSKLNNALSISWRQKPFYPDCGIKIGG